MKRLIAVMLLTIGVASAAEMPYLIGSVKNRDNGQIQFTSHKGECGDKFFVFIRGDGGRVEGRGCYLFGPQFIVVTWQDGDTYTYDYEALQFSPEMARFVEQKK